MSFPKELKKNIENCILNIIYPREEIISLFKSCGCDRKDINTVARVKSLTRAKIIYLMFARISDKPDGGAAIFRALNNKFLTWTKFDPQYFVKLNKLSEEKAQKSLDKLKDNQYLLED